MRVELNEKEKFIKRITEMTNKTHHKRGVSIELEIINNDFEKDYIFLQLDINLTNLTIGKLKTYGVLEVVDFLNNEKHLNLRLDTTKCNDDFLFKYELERKLYEVEVKFNITSKSPVNSFILIKIKNHDLENKLNDIMNKVNAVKSKIELSKVKNPSQYIPNYRDKELMEYVRLFGIIGGVKL